MNKTAVILINIGTPDKPEKKYVRRYLFQFLNDQRVIDLPFLLQKIVVNFIIVPFRTNHSTKLYQKLWTIQGSSLLVHAQKLSAKVQKHLGHDFDVFYAMRYGNPSLKKLLKNLNDKAYNKMIFFPLYPQYASATTGSTIELIMSQLKKRTTIPDLKFITQFYNTPQFIEAWYSQIQNYNLNEYEHIIFSFHGLPLRQIQKIHPKIPVTNCTCEKEMPEHTGLCYKAACYETARLLASKFKIDPENYTVTFQSRLTKNWLSPFTDRVIKEKAQRGIKKIAVLSPSFVSDCLETLVEIKITYKEIFEKYGGERLQLIESLNSSDSWGEKISQLILTSN